VTIALYGGLGNQMFQYAMGRALAMRHGLSLELDLHGFAFDRHYRRTFELGAFNLSPEARRANRPVAFRLGRALRRLSQEWPAAAALARPWALVECSAAFDCRNLALPAGRGAYVMGYWQDERYFGDCSEVIRRDFAPVGALSPANDRIAGQIRSVEAVAVHVRRLHFAAAQPGASASRPGPEPGATLTLDYYRRAIALLASRVAHPHYFVFSDDPAWAREHLVLPGSATVLGADRGPDHQDLILMSTCRHHVIANSSFSWWGAWLGQADGQVVIAPVGFPYVPNLPARWTGLAPS
jgi:hypothetical protein